MSNQLPFYLTQIMDVGTSHPVIARIAMGIPELLENCEFSKKKKTDLTNLCFDIAKDLVQAEKQAIPVIQEIEKIEKKLEETKPVVMPSVIDSVINIDNTRVFLKFAKAALRNLAAALGIIFDEGFSEPKFQDILNKLDKKLKSKDDEKPFIITILNHYNAFADELVKRRNDDEHDHYSKIFLKNYRIEKEKGCLVLKRPCFRDDTLIFEYIHNSLPMLFYFIEESLVASISLNLHESIVIKEIPEAKRNPNFPRRFRLDV